MSQVDSEGTVTSIAQRRPWVVVSMLAVLAFVNYADRAAFGVAAQPITEELGFSPAEFGALGALFTVGYIPGNLIGGLSGDRFGAMRILRLTVTIWSLVVASLTFAYSYAFFVANRLLFGLAEGPNFALDTKLITQSVSVAARGRALAGVTVGIPLGTAVASPLIGLTIAAVGWRTMFLALGLLGLAWVAVSFLLMDRDRAQAAHLRENPSEGAQSAPDAEEKVSWRRLLASRSVWAVTLAGFTGAYFNFMLITWLPEYFRLALGFTLTSSAIAAAAPWVGAAAGIVVSGLASDVILHRTGSVRWSRAGVLGCGLLGAGACLAGTASTTSVWLSVTLMTAAAFFAYPSVTNLLFGITASIVPAGSVAGATGLAVGIASVGGLVGPALTGVLVQATDGFGVALLVAASVTALGGVVAILGVGGDRLS